MERIEIVENGLFLVFEIADDKCFKFLHFGKKPFNEKDIIARSTSYGFRFVEINLAGYDRPYERHGNKYIVTARMSHCSKKPNLLSMNIKPADNTKAVLPTINSLLFILY